MFVIPWAVGSVASTTNPASPPTTMDESPTVTVDRDHISDPATAVAREVIRRGQLHEAGPERATTTTTAGR